MVMSFKVIYHMAKTRKVKSWGKYLCWYSGWMCVSFARNKDKKAEILFILYSWDSCNAPFHGDSVYKLRSLACQFLQCNISSFSNSRTKMSYFGWSCTLNLINHLSRPTSSGAIFKKGIGFLFGLSLPIYMYHMIQYIMSDNRKPLLI